MTIDDFFNEEIIDWCVWYFHQFDEKRFNNIKYIQETHWSLPFNRRFGQYIKERVERFMPEARIHSIYIGNDVRPGGIHTDGWLYEGEKDLSYKTILVPLRFNIPSSTVIFNEKFSQGVTLNNVTGLGTNGINTMQQISVLDSSQPFDSSMHQQYLRHLDITGLSGLTVHSVQPWKPGRAMSWFRDRWHGPAYFEGNNIERYHLTMMTHRNER